MPAHEPFHRPGEGRGGEIREVDADADPCCLDDTAQGTVIDAHCSTKWPNGTNVGPQVALRNAGDLRSLAADKGYDDMSFREELRAEGVRPLIKHRVFAPYDYAHNARINDELYNQRSVCETVNSVIKRSDGV